MHMPVQLPDRTKVSFFLQSNYVLFFDTDSYKTIVQFNNQISATITASPPSPPLSLQQKKKNPKYVHLRDWSLNRLVDFSGEPITYQEECQDSSI